MSASFPPAPVSGPFMSPSPMYPNQGCNYNDPYQQGYNQPSSFPAQPGSSFPTQPGSSYPTQSGAFPTQQPPQPNQQMMKQNYDPRQLNGYNFPSNGGQQLMSPGMGQPYQPPQMQRQPPNYYNQSPMGQMSQNMPKMSSSGPSLSSLGPPTGMNTNCMGPTSMGPSLQCSNLMAMGPGSMGPPNGMSQMMMQQQGMGQMPTSSAGPTNQMAQQMKSPMSGPTMSMRTQQPTQMNSPGIFTAPAPPRPKQSMPSPSTMHNMMPGHPMTSDPPVSSPNHLVQAPQMSSSQGGVQQPPTPETPFTAVTHFEMPPAFMQYQNEFKKTNPATASYYDRRPVQLKKPYPNGQLQAMPQEPATFGFVPGQPYYEERYDRRNMQPPTSTAPATNSMTNPMIQRQMSAPGIASPSYAQQQLMGAPAGPAAKKSKRSASTSVDLNNSNTYASQQNRMMPMGSFNNPNLKSPSMMPSLTNPTGMQQMPPSSGAGGSNNMHMMGEMGSNGMSSGGMPPNSMGQNGMAMSNGMPQGGMGIGGIPSNGHFNGAHDMRPPPPQYSQMQIPSSSQQNMQQNYNNQLQQRYGILSPPAQQGPSQMSSQKQQNGSHPGISMQQQQMQQYLHQLPPCNSCKRQIPTGSPAKICANPSCRRAFHDKCIGLTDAATSMLDTNPDQIGWVCPVCDPRPR